MEAIVNMTAPNNTRDVRAFLVLVKYYSDMWDRQSHLIYFLTALMSHRVKFKWTYMEQKDFDNIKCTFTHDTLLVYLYFKKRFDIHTDARYYQVGAVITQDGDP